MIGSTGVPPTWHRSFARFIPDHWKIYSNKDFADRLIDAIFGVNLRSDIGLPDYVQINQGYNFNECRNSN